MASRQAAAHVNDSPPHRVAHRDAIADPWRGVSLGGWLLLEPGPSFPLFDSHLDSTRCRPRSEWDLLKQLRKTVGKKRAAEVITKHREQHITKDDFVRIRACGLNAVRVPFGYWCVLGPSADDIYVGPALEYIDRAVAWAEECGLQVVLDLHGCPGGESGEAPCGRRMRPDGTWKWKNWRFTESLKALKVVAQRYKARKCVTGIAVCNEPSNKVPLTALCRYYDKACDVIRAAGMLADQVAVVLPDFQRPEGVVAEKFSEITRGRHKNFCFDVHCYHCFENEYNGKSFAEQFRAIQANAAMFRKYPMVVGEWSLALGCATWQTCQDMAEDDAYRLFGTSQLEAFEEASHGSFFWNWTEDKQSLEWNFQLAHSKGLVSGPPPVLPQWGCSYEDPLEEILSPSPPEPRIFFDEPMYMRVQHGRYIDVERFEVQARWPDKGGWQQLFFCAPAESARQAQVNGRRPVCDGDIVQIRAKNGRFLTVDEKGNVSAVCSRLARDESSQFVLRIGDHAMGLRHRGAVWLQNCKSGMFLDADDDQHSIYARYDDQGNWQKFNVEKHLTVEKQHIGAASALVALAPRTQTRATHPATPQKSPTKTPKKRTGAVRAESANSKARPPNKRRRAVDVSTEAKLDVCPASQ